MNVMDLNFFPANQAIMPLAKRDVSTSKPLPVSDQFVAGDQYVLPSKASAPPHVALRFGTLLDVKPREGGYLERAWPESPLLKCNTYQSLHPLAWLAFAMQQAGIKVYHLGFEWEFPRGGEGAADTDFHGSPEPAPEHVSLTNAIGPHYGVLTVNPFSVPKERKAAVAELFDKHWDASFARRRVRKTQRKDEKQLLNWSRVDYYHTLHSYSNFVDEIASPHQKAGIKGLVKRIWDRDGATFDAEGDNISTPKANRIKTVYVGLRLSEDYPQSPIVDLYRDNATDSEPVLTFKPTDKGKYTIC